MRAVDYNTLRARIGRARRLILFLDFDGTLAPIVQRAHEAKMSKETRMLVATLAKRYLTYIVTGRSLTDIMRRGRVPRVRYCGTHGFEWYRGGRRFRAKLTKQEVRAIEDVRKALIPVVLRHKGTYVEDKGIALAFHYRTAPKGAAARQAALRALARLPSKKHFHIVQSKMALDIRPEGRTKGDFVREVLKKEPRGTLALYIGDDRTDEDAFKALRGGITVRVGKKAGSAAKYFVSARSGVDTLLKRLAELNG